MANPYESDRLLAEYLLFHYGTPEEILPYAFGPREALDFAVRTVQAVALAGKTTDGKGRALDLGCAVGRSSFELARFYGEVLGVDFSHQFVRAARHLARGESICYERLEEGEITTALVARAPLGIEAARVRFEQGDAGALPEEWKDFDCVHAANLLCRMARPTDLLDRLPGLVRAGGLLVLATPHSWLDSFTAPENWIGGRVESGRPARTLDRLRTILAPSFDEVLVADEPFLIREHARKFQWGVSALSVWRRKKASSRPRRKAAGPEPDRPA